MKSGRDPQNEGAGLMALKRTGYEPPNVVRRSADALAPVAWEQPTAAVVDAVLSGERGLLGLIRTLRQEGPGCAVIVAVIVVAPFPALHDAVVAAGACALVLDHDLRTLCLALARGLHGTSTCTCGFELPGAVTAPASSWKRLSLAPDGQAGPPTLWWSPSTG